MKTCNCLKRHEYQKFNWANISEYVIHIFKYNLECNLSSIKIPFASITCTDFNYTHHYEDFLSFYSIICNACLKATSESLTMSKCKSFKKKYLGGISLFDHL